MPRFELPDWLIDLLEREEGAGAKREQATDTQSKVGSQRLASPRSAGWVFPAGQTL
jgi:hypothetical protein